MAWGQARVRGYTQKQWKAAKKISKTLRKQWKAKEKDWQVSIKLDYKKKKAHDNFIMEATFYAKAATPSKAKGIAKEKLANWMDKRFLMAIGKSLWKVKANRAKKPEAADYVRYRNKKTDAWKEEEMPNEYKQKPMQARSNI